LADLLVEDLEDVKALIEELEIAESGSRNWTETV
jgi:hypothetical protein